MKKKICFKCKKIIDEKSNYYAFIEVNNKKIIDKSYAHKRCWNDFLHKVGDTQEAMNLIRSMKGQMQKIGLLPEEEIKI